jgi:hypothetical protein
VTSEKVLGTAPLLVLERVERDPDTPNRMAGTVRFGGHRLHVDLEVAPQYFGLITPVTMPKLLKLHGPSEQAVVKAMNRIRAGDKVSLPLDLTGEIRGVDPPHPFVPMDPPEEARLDAAADAVEVRIDRVEWAEPGADPPLVVADVAVDGVPMTVRAWLYAAPGANTLMLWLGKQRPKPSREQARAIELAVLAHRPASEPSEDG